MTVTQRTIPPLVKAIMVSLGALIVAGVLTWQALVLHGAPDASAKNMSPFSLMMSSAVLVLREGLEAVLVLAIVTSGAIRNKQRYWRSVLVGVTLALVASVITWFVAVAVLSSINAPALSIQAGTGLLAVVVLLGIGGWYSHTYYWTRWIGHHNKRKQVAMSKETSALSWGLVALGFTCIYREGFEIVLFLQDLRLKGGSGIVLRGAGVGLALTAIVAALTFFAHQKLPYKKMLIATGLMLALVLIVMVGESAQEMQQAGWILTHHLPIAIPEWMGTWLAAFPNVEGLVAQTLAAVLMFGSYGYTRWKVKRSVTLCGRAAPSVKAGDANTDLGAPHSPKATSNVRG